MPQPSSRRARLRRGVGIYATGFILDAAQLKAISVAVCKGFRGASVFGLKWHVGNYNYELLPMGPGGHNSPHLFAISFFPYLKDATASDMLFSRLCSLSDEQKNTWHERFGQHAGLVLEDLEPHTMRYPTNGAVADFMSEEIQAAIEANEELWKFLVPIPSPSPRFPTQIPVS
ncbi:hypothetical protein B0H12DRAFT_1237777 [Mycena haematopus]|nr:hypothetical protein B0H12DRAFT_1237777 [Mycena haematopus]